MSDSFYDDVNDLIQVWVDEIGSARVGLLRIEIDLNDPKSKHPVETKKHHDQRKGGCVTLQNIVHDVLLIL